MVGETPERPGITSGFLRDYDCYTSTIARRSLDPHSARIPAVEDVRRIAGPVSVVAAVTAALVILKGVIAYRDLSRAAIAPCLWHGSWPPFLLRVLACSSEDMAVGAVILAVSLLLSRRLRPGGRTVLMRLLEVSSVAAVVWMIVNFQSFHVLRHFVSVPLIQLAGGMRVERSLYSYAPLPLLIAFVAVPAGALMASYAIRLAVTRTVLSRLLPLIRPVVLLIVAGILIAVSLFARQRWFTPVTGDFPQNPHLLLARSWIRSMRTIRFDGGDDSARADLVPVAWSQPPVAVDGPRPRNIIVIVLESVGAIYLHDYGSPFATTPRLDAIAGRSLVFDNIYSTSNNTVPSGLSLFGAEYNEPVVPATIMEHPNYPVASAASWLHGLGYRTVFLAGGDWNYVTLPRFLAGFDLARDGYQHWSRERRPWPLTRGSYADDDLFADAGRALDELRVSQRPFFLMLWTYDTHSGYRDNPCAARFPESRFPAALATLSRDSRLVPDQQNYPEKTAEFRRYLASICRDDQLIGQLIDHLDRAGLSDSTIVAITGDHGEAFGQHGWYGHGNSFYDEDVHVPLLLISRSLHRYEPRSAVVADQVDLWPTLASVAGFAANPMWQGRSLLRPGPDEAFFTRPGAIGVRQGRYKLVLNYAVDNTLLFDMAADPGETHDLASGKPALVSTLRKRVLSWAHFEAERTQQRMAHPSTQPLPVPDP
jgi:arylsulfatase A-like enzyme